MNLQVVNRYYESSSRRVINNFMTLSYSTLKHVEYLINRPKNFLLLNVDFWKERGWTSIRNSDSDNQTEFVQTLDGLTTRWYNVFTRWLRERVCLKVSMIVSKANREVWKSFLFLFFSLSLQRIKECLKMIFTIVLKLLLFAFGILMKLNT